MRAPPNRQAPPVDMHHDSAAPTGGARAGDAAAGYAYAPRPESSAAHSHAQYHLDPAAGYARDANVAPSPLPPYSEFPPADPPHAPRAGYYQQVRRADVAEHASSRANPTHRP